MTRTYLTVSIPYVNARPHVGYALELVEADVLARTRRQGGGEVRFLGGTDENSLKSVVAAEEAGRPVAELVEENAARFRALVEPLGITFDDFIKTSTDPRHRAGVERLWRRIGEHGDLYRASYEGRYCVGCELFVSEDDLVDGRCREHHSVPELVSEENWFFRLSRYAGEIRRRVVSGELSIEPAIYRNQVLAWLDEGLSDISVSRAAGRTRGFGIPVPDDPDQVVYVWWDALMNYITALGADESSPDYETWWLGSDERIHVIGKGIVRFHALYWPALLVSVGAPLPTRILVHPYLSSDGEKISKSAGNGAEPLSVIAATGTDALRWWFSREVSPGADADFSTARVIERANAELAHGVANLVHRTVSVIERRFEGSLPVNGGGVDDELVDEVAAAAARAAQIEGLDLRGATAPLVAAIGRLNRFIEDAKPWDLRRCDDATAAACLETVVAACRLVATALAPYVPELAARLSAQLGEGHSFARPTPLFARLEPDRLVPA